jgi:hypothetical protein
VFRQGTLLTYAATDLKRNQTAPSAIHVSGTEAPGSAARSIGSATAWGRITRYVLISV